MKTETKGSHTPGPWRAVGRHIWSDTRCLAIVRKRGQTNVFKDEDDGNAALIAAGPELLEELKTLVGIICGGERDVTLEDCDSAKAVIEKATP